MLVLVCMGDMTNHGFHGQEKRLHTPMLLMRNVKLLARKTVKLPGGAQEETDYSPGLSGDRAGPGSTTPGLMAGQLLPGSK